MALPLVLVAAFVSGSIASESNECGGIIINPTNSICCEDRVYLRYGLIPSCCGSMAYDASTHLCCEGNVWKLMGIEPKCCGGRMYDGATHHCVDGLIIHRADVPEDLMNRRHPAIGKGGHPLMRGNGRRLGYGRPGAGYGFGNPGGNPGYGRYDNEGRLLLPSGGRPLLPSGGRPLTPSGGHPLTPSGGHPLINTGGDGQPLGNNNRSPLPGKGGEPGNVLDWQNGNGDREYRIPVPETEEDSRGEVDDRDFVTHGLDVPESDKRYPSIKIAPPPHRVTHTPKQIIEQHDLQELLRAERERAGKGSFEGEWDTHANVRVPEEEFETDAPDEEDRGYAGLRGHAPITWQFTTPSSEREVENPKTEQCCGNEGIILYECCLSSLNNSVTSILPKCCSGFVVKVCCWTGGDMYSCCRRQQPCCRGGGPREEPSPRPHELRTARPVWTRRQTTQRVTVPRITHAPPITRRAVAPISRRPQCCTSWPHRPRCCSTLIMRPYCCYREAVHPSTIRPRPRFTTSRPTTPRPTTLPPITTPEPTTRRPVDIRITTPRGPIDRSCCIMLKIRPSCCSIIMIRPNCCASKVSRRVPTVTQAPSRPVRPQCCRRKVTRPSPAVTHAPPRTVHPSCCQQTRRPTCCTTRRQRPMCCQKPSSQPPAYQVTPRTVAPVMPKCCQQRRRPVCCNSEKVQPQCCSTSPPARRPTSGPPESVRSCECRKRRDCCSSRQAPKRCCQRRPQASQPFPPPKHDEESRGSCCSSSTRGTCCWVLYVQTSRLPQCCERMEERPQSDSPGAGKVPRAHCASGAYDPMSHMCCDGVKHSKLGIRPRCCGSYGYDAFYFYCCSGRVARDCRKARRPSK